MSGPVYGGRPVVYQVDTQNHVLHPVRGIGSRALFVAENRCVCVDNTRVPTVQAGIIYYADLSEIRSYNFEALAWEEEPRVVYGYGVGGLWINDHTFEIDRLLAAYCRINEHSELQMVPPNGKDGTTHMITMIAICQIDG